MKNEKYVINIQKEVPFHNNVDFCVGTGRIGLALQKEYQEQLKLVQSEIGFQYIRGHGLFSDDMAIYQEREDKEGNRIVEYNFTYLDLVMDSYMQQHIRPFLELGFMPYKMASGDQTVFYWKGNVTPPKSYEDWCKLVQSTLRHLIDRYGEDEVLTWPVEVWNEPNLPVFWKDADMDEYFKLFEKTFYAVKEVNKDFKVGGPAICGVDDVRWMQKFMEFCHTQNIPVDFISRHHYTTEVPEQTGHYGYAELSDADMGFDVLHTSRVIIDNFPEFAGKGMHITEFNTSYIPNCPLHDTNQNAAYVAYLLSRLGEDCESYSYWTFGDIFEEFGVPFTPFHGGFGLVANGQIPKPTFWTFKFFKDLKGKCVLKTRNTVVVKRENGSFCGVMWNDTQKRTGKDLKIDLELNVKGSYSLIQKTVDENTCNPLKLWHDMGEPSSLSENQKLLLRESARPQVSSSIIPEGENGIHFSTEIKENGVIYFELISYTEKNDRGYSYKRVMQYE